MAKLQMLKPRVSASAASRIPTMQPGRPGTVERLRGSAGVKDRNNIKRRDCGVCQLCGRAGSVVDHKRPLWDGGTDDDDNKWLLCDECHNAKTSDEAGQRGRGGVNLHGF